MANTMTTEIVGKFRDLISPKLKRLRTELALVQSQSRTLNSSIVGVSSGVTRSANTANNAVSTLGTGLASAVVGAEIARRSMTQAVTATGSAQRLAAVGLLGYVTDFTRSARAMAATFTNSIIGSLARIETTSTGLTLFKKRLQSTMSGTVGIVTGAIGEISSGLIRLSSLATSAGALLSGVLAASVVNISRKFEVMKVTLDNLTGGDGDDAFAFLLDLAKTLPVTLEEVTSAFIKLRSLGLDPTKEAITAYTDVASAMGKPLQQFVEAVGDAVTGEFERLKEFGIRAKSIGNDVQFTFKGIKSQLISKTDSAGIETYLQGLSKLDGVAGAATKQMSTLNGEISNLSVEFDQMANELADDTGILGVLKTGIRFIADYISEWDKLMLAMRLGLTKTLRSVALQIVDIKFGFKRLSADIGYVFEVLGKAVANVFIIAANIVNGTINALVKGTLQSINFLISQVNKIPGLDLGTLNANSGQAKIYSLLTEDAAAYSQELARLTSEQRLANKEINAIADEFVDISIMRQQATENSRKGAEAFNNKLKEEVEIKRELAKVDQQSIIDTEALARAKQLLIDKMQPYYDLLQNTFSGFFNDLVYDTGDAFRNMADNFSRAVTQMVSEALAADLVKTLFGSPGSTGTSALGGGLQSVVASMFGGREHGGPVMGGTPYIVGEKRPEIFVPNSSGTIIPNTNGLAGGGNTYNINAIDAQSTADFIGRNQVAFASAVNNANTRYNMR